MTDSDPQQDRPVDRPTDRRSLRARLDELLQRPPQPAPSSVANAPGVPPVGGLAPVVFRRELPRSRRPVPGPEPAAGSGGLRLEEAVPGEQFDGPQGGRAYLIRTSLAELAGSDALDQAFARALEQPDWPLRTWLVQRGLEPGPAPDTVVFLDLETAGLGSAPLFLIGALVWSVQGLHAEQYLARDYAEEQAAIARFLADHRHRALLVTFNGKSFDYPFLRARAAATGVAFGWHPGHLDLLHASRRAWGRLLPDCRLQTLERYVCRRARSSDIGGELIPAAYHAFVRTGDATEMVEIIRHNLLDLATLAELMTRFPPF